MEDMQCASKEALLGSARAQMANVAAASRPLAEIGKKSATHYWLPQHVHVCATEDGVVFLDLKHDKYVGLVRSHASGLSRVIPGWPAIMTTRDTIPGQVVMDLANTLVRRGLLTANATDGRPATPVTLDPVRMQSADADSRWKLDVRLGHVATFLAASASAALALESRSLEAIVRSIENKKRRRPSGPSVNVERLSALAGVFSCLRCYVYSESGRCLFHALALTYFLSHYRQFPTWVIGVKTGPFTAHSWVQFGDRVFDDRPERVCQYTPILAV